MKTLALSNLTLNLFLLFSINQIFAQITPPVVQIHFRSYHEGRYYDLAGVKHVGFIDFTADSWGNQKINFKVDTFKAKNQKIDIKDIKCVVVYRENHLYSPELDTLNQNDSVKNKQLDPNYQPKMVLDSLVVLSLVDDNFINPTTLRFCKFLTDGVHSKIYMREESEIMPRVANMDGFGKSTAGVGTVDGFGRSTAGVGTRGGYGMPYYGFFDKNTVFVCEMNGKVFTITRSNFKETLYSAFADHPELVEKIKSKEFKYRDLDTIIEDYIIFKKNP